VRKQNSRTTRKQPLLSRPALRFVPGLEVLEDRTAPALLSGGPSPHCDDPSTIRLVDEPPAAELAGQVIVLDLDGAHGVNYDGPVTVSGIDVPAFRGPGHLAGQEQAVVASLLGALQQQFAAAGVTFTTEAQAAGEYSTVYVGGRGAE